MNPTWQTADGSIRLYCADCLSILPQLEAGSVVTDPPYGNRNTFGKQYRTDGIRTLQFAWDGPHVNTAVVSALEMATRDAEAFFCFCGISQVSELELVLSSRFTVKPAAWVKNCPPPALPGNWWPSGFELAIYGYRSGAWFGDTNTSRSNVFRTDTYRFGSRANEKVDHPTQKWLPLMDHIVRSVSRPLATCLDPFMGSGTTGVACIRTGRRFIGIEIEPKYFAIAVKRIEAELNRTPLFEPPVAIQKHLIDL